MTKKTISTKMENVKCVIGQNTKQPNTVTMRIHERDILEAVQLFQTLREGNKPESGLIGLELSAIYLDESDMQDNETIELDFNSDPVSGEELTDQEDGSRGGIEREGGEDE